MRAADVVPLVAPPTTKIGYPVLIGTAAPANLVQGMAWLDTTTPPGTLKIYSSGTWVVASGGATGLPAATQQDQLLVSDAGLNWQAGDLDQGRY